MNNGLLRFHADGKMVAWKTTWVAALKVEVQIIHIKKENEKKWERKRM